jgi:hypothetical protein
VHSGMGGLVSVLLASKFGTLIIALSSLVSRSIILALGVFISKLFGLSWRVFRKL